MKIFFQKTSKKLIPIILLLIALKAISQDESYQYTNSSYDLTKFIKKTLEVPDELTVNKQNGVLSVSGLFPKKGYEVKFSKGIKLPESRGQVGAELLIDSEGQNLNTTSNINVFFLIRDSNGKRWTFNSNYDAWSSRKAPFNTWVVFESFALEAKNNDGIPRGIASPANDGFPQGALTLEGFLFKPRNEIKCTVFIKSIFQENIDRNIVNLHWGLGNRFLCNGLPEAEKPYLCVTDLASSPGKYCFQWVVKNSTTRETVSSGKKEFTIKKQRVPSKEKLQFPAFPEGTYRMFGKLYLKNRLSSEGFPLAKDVKEYEDWFYIIRNTKPTSGFVIKHAPVIEVAPDRYSGIYSENEVKNGLKVPIKINAEINNGIVQTDWLTYDEKTISSSKQTTEFSGKSEKLFYTDFPIHEDERAFFLVVSLFDSKNNLIEKKKHLLGIKGGEEDGPDFSTLPSLSDYDPCFHVGVTGIGPKFRGVDRYKSNLEGLIKNGVRAIELHIDWAFLEPLPGVWTFRELDNILDITYKAGVKVTMRFRNDFTHYTVPDWIQSDYLCQQNGIVDGLISNGPSYSTCNKSWHKANHNYLSTIVRRYSKHPAITGFKVLHNTREAFYVDRPFKYQFTDYSHSSLLAFHIFLQKNYKNLEELNAAWSTSYSDWEEIKLPQPFWGEEQMDTRVCWGDFKSFKAEVFNNHLNNIIDAIRKYENEKKLCIYTLNALTGPGYKTVLDRMKNDNIEFATGGAIPHGTIEFTRLFSALNRIHVEPEPNSYSMRDAVMLDDHAGMMLEGAVGKKPTFFFYWTTVTPPMEEAQRELSALRRVNDWELAMDKIGSINLPPMDLGIAFSMENLGFVKRSYYMNSILGDIKPFFNKLGHLGLMVQGIDDIAEYSDYSKQPVIWVPSTGAEVMSTALRKNLKNYVENGGYLIASVHSGTRYPVVECTVPRDETIIRNESISFTKELGFSKNEIENDSEKAATAILEIEGEPQVLLSRPVALVKKPGDKVLARFNDGGTAMLERKVGQGTVLMVGGVIHYKTGESFAELLKKIYLERGGRRWIYTDNTSVSAVVTPHFSTDGTFYAYVLNGTENDTDVKLLFDVLPPGVEASTKLKITDLVNNVEYTPKSYSELREQGMSTMLSPQKAGFIQFTPLK
ncbi:beta-galactosidase [uncultured Draconibacterium sp.]|uniref:beta-galactosidase n=1 Tax=uncultured Draconibacterium sp. TaxID=1573823 RepID=UPI0025CE24C8|nr:beta-galactosidase [uncultured Draconibacterium sp.]